jgi:hypothetical protein
MDKQIKHLHDTWVSPDPWYDPTVQNIIDHLSAAASVAARLGIKLNNIDDLICELEEEVA